jgi:uncharacterized protein YcfJ
MRIFRRLGVLPLLVVTGACAGETQKTPDLSFLEDLELAVSAAPGQGFVSPVELGIVEEAAAPEVAPVAPAAPTRAATPARSQSTTARQTSSTSAPRAPVARTVTVKNTKRDAVIGAGAGAVIGAAAGGSNRRVQGAAVGAVVGGVIGGVIGNNVDKSTKVVYEHNSL